MTIQHPDYGAASKAIPHIVGSHTDISYILRCACHGELSRYSNEQAAHGSVSWYEHQGHAGVYVEQCPITLNIIEDY